MITLHPDKITYRGPQVDGGWIISLHVGGYESEQISQLVQLPTDQVSTVQIQEVKDFQEKQ